MNHETAKSLRQTLANELIDAVRGVLEFERLNSVISGPYDRLLNAYNAVIREANRAKHAARVSDPLDEEQLAQALFETQDERLHGGVDGLGLGSHEADAAAIAAAYARRVRREP